MNINRIDELLALQKAIMFVKFGSEEYDAHYLACSPITGELLKKINEDLHNYYIANKIPHSIQYGNIEDYPTYLDKVKIHLHNIDNWAQLERNIQEDVIKDLCSPFSILASTIEILQFGDMS